MKSKSIQSIPAADTSVISGGAVAALNRPKVENFTSESVHLKAAGEFCQPGCQGQVSYELSSRPAALALAKSGRLTLADAESLVKEISGDFARVLTASVIIKSETIHRETRTYQV